MGIIKEIYPQCDNCGWTNPDMVSLTIKELKLKLKLKNEWITKSDGTLYCSKECYEEGYLNEIKTLC